MKTSKKIFFLVLAVTVLSSFKINSYENSSVLNSASGTLESFKPDLDKSVVKWKGEMLGLYSNSGILKFKDAKIEVSNGKISGGRFIVDMNTITPTDENYDISSGSTPERLAAHLSSDDFFNITEFPTAEFLIKNVEGNSATGALTVKGVTYDEKVNNISIVSENGKTKITADLIFNRKKYDVSWDHPVKEKVLSEDIIVKIELYN